MSTPQQVLYIIRHGETDFNLNGRIQGRGVNTDLNERGRAQSLAFYNAYKHIAFNHLMASSLKRAQQTLEPFRQAGYQLEIYPQLDEMNWGIHEGAKTDTTVSHVYRELVSSWKSGKLDVGVEGGETPLQLQMRQREFIDQVLPGKSGNVLMCTHGRAMRSLLCTLLNKDLCNMDDYPHRNLALYVLQRTSSGFEVLQFSNCDHLQDLPIH